MKKYWFHIAVPFAFLVMITGFKKNTEQQNALAEKLPEINNYVGIFTDPVKVSIADTRVVKGDKGQRPVEVMISLSEAASRPVTVKYATQDESASAGADYIATSGTVTFAPGETLKRIRVFIVGEAAADADEDAHVEAEVTLKINLTEVQNAILEKKTAIITIIKDILSDPRLSGGNRSVYEVRFTFTGYTLLHGTIEDCPIRPSGKVVLTGLLSGIEKTADPADDVTYTGTLQLDIDMDICSVKGEGGDTKLCNITVTGAGPVKTILDIYYDGRGGYIRIDDTTSAGFIKHAGGTCDPAEISEERTMIPLETIATIFNGLELPMLTSRTLRVGPSQIQRSEFGELLVEVLRKIR